jgi:hypothetical protein
LGLTEPLRFPRLLDGHDQIVPVTQGIDNAHGIPYSACSGRGEVAASPGLINHSGKE